MGNPHDAAEITQEAILRTFWKIQEFHGRAHFYTWLYRTALNLCYRRLSDGQARIAERSVPLEGESREEGGQVEPAIADRSPSPRELACAREEAELVRRALASLRPRDFRILVLREFEELSYEEIALRLRIRPASIPSRLSRARSALAHRLRQLGLE